MKMPKHYLIMFAALLCCFLLKPAVNHARENSFDQAGREAIIPLSELVTIDEIDKEDQINLKENQINLVTAANGFQMPLPIPKRTDMARLVLHLDFIHSTSLLKHRSQVVVLVNGIIVSQVGLDPNSPHVIADIPIPLEFIREGYNKVEFRVAQHYTEGCEDPTSKELWTQVNTIKSYFHILYDYGIRNFTLAYLDDLFDKKLVDYGLTIMRTRKPADYRDIDLNWGALAVEGASLRLDYKPVNLTIATAKKKTGLSAEDEKNSLNPLLWLDQSALKNDLILIATREELSPFLNPNLPDNLFKQINGPYLAVIPAADPRFHIVVISGTTEDEVSTAAQAFTLNRFTFTDHPSMVVEELNIPAVTRNSLPRIIQPGIRYPFKELGFKTVTKISHKRVDLQFNVPPDILARQKAVATFKLDFTYGAAFREDSVLNIFLNGQFEKAIYLDNKLGARFNDYEFYIPVSSFLPGQNTLRFEPVLPPLVTGECTAVQNSNAVITIYDSSSIELPLIDHYVQLPDFKLFNRTGFPYLDMANGEDMGILVRGHENGTILAAWQLLAKLTQKASMPLYKAEISFRQIEDRHLIIVGTRKALYEDDLRNAPVKLGQVFEFDYPIDKHSKNRKMTWLERVKLLINPLLPDQAGEMNTIYANMKFKSYLGKDSLLVGYQSADNPEKLVMLFTNEDPDLLYRSTRRLVDPAFWDMLDDNLAIWNEDDYSLRTQKSKVEFYIGETSLRNSLAYYYSIHKLKFILLVAGLLLVIAWLSHRWMNRYTRRHHNEVTEISA